MVVVLILGLLQRVVVHGRSGGLLAHTLRHTCKQGGRIRIRVREASDPDMFRPNHPDPDHWILNLKIICVGKKNKMIKYLALSWTHANNFLLRIRNRSHTTDKKAGAGPYY